MEGITVTRLEGREVRVEKKKNTQKIKRVKGQRPKKVDWYNVELTQGQEPDEETKPILWIERPTSALVGASSL